eukprot:COSAG06_NODE_692_length_13043_cov_369.439509_11_plen_156_part_00
MVVQVSSLPFCTHALNVRCSMTAARFRFTKRVQKRVLSLRYTCASATHDVCNCFLQIGHLAILCLMRLIWVFSVCSRSSALLYLQGQAGVEGKDGGQVQAGAVRARCLRDQGAPGHPGALYFVSLCWSDCACMYFVYAMMRLAHFIGVFIYVVLT